MMEENDYIYVKGNKVECFLILSLYIDDILLAWNNFEMLKETKSWLFYIFENMGVLSVDKFCT